MPRKRNSINETAPEIELETELEDKIVISSTPEEEIESISDKLAEIRKQEGVIGYIFRGEAAATIDLNEPDKIIDYAMLSTELLDCAQVIEQQFDIGSVECILAEGKNTKVLCIANGGNRTSVFMNEAFDHEDIEKQLIKIK